MPGTQAEPGAQIALVQRAIGIGQHQKDIRQHEQQMTPDQRHGACLDAEPSKQRLRPEEKRDLGRQQRQIDEPKDAARGMQPVATLVLQATQRQQQGDCRGADAEPQARGDGPRDIQARPSPIAQSPGLRQKRRETPERRQRPDRKGQNRQRRQDHQ